MAYASKAGRARTNASNPQAHAICDRCGFRYNHINLQWQFDWRGSALQNLRVLVCKRCNDTPDEQLRSIIIPPDPPPIINARVEPFTVDEAANFLTPTGSLNRIGVPTYTSGTTITNGANTITYEPFGNPTGQTQAAQMPLVADNIYGVALPVLSMTSAGLAQVNVTCSSAHGLSTGSQVSVEGVTNSLAAGYFSVIVTTATAFTYAVYSAIPAGSVMTGGTLVKTANIGLPYGYTTVPLVPPPTNGMPL